MKKTNELIIILVVIFLLFVVLLTQANCKDSNLSITIENKSSNHIDCTYTTEFKQFNNKYFKSVNPFKLKINHNNEISPEILNDSSISFTYNPTVLQSMSTSDIYIIVETKLDPKFAFKQTTVHSGKKEDISSKFCIGTDPAKTINIKKNSENNYFIFLNCNSNPFKNESKSEQRQEIKNPHIVPTNMSILFADIEIDNNMYFLKRFRFDMIKANPQVNNTILGFRSYIYSNYLYINSVCSICSQSEQNNTPIEVIIKGLDTLENKNFKLKYENKSKNHVIPVPFNKNMFSYTVDDGSEHYTATHYKYENNKIQLTFDKVPMQIQDHTEEQSDINSQTQKYGIKFAQSGTISFEGTINENEWSYEHNKNNLCAKLKTIYIKKEGKQIGKFMGFPKDDNYLLSTADINMNKTQGDSIFVCIDQDENPGLLKIKNIIQLSPPNIIHNFEISDFKFLHDSNIEISRIDKDHIIGEPSLLLNLSNTTNGLQYDKCNILFQQKGNWKIQAESEWKQLGSNSNIWRCYLQEFTVNTKEKAVYGVTYNPINKYFQLIIPSQDKEKETRIEVYTQSDEKPEKLEFYVDYLSSQSQEEIPFNKAHFRLKNNPYKEITDIKYNEKDNKFKPRPSILITIETKEEEITEDDYCFVFEDKGAWKIEKTIQNDEWVPTTVNNIVYYKATIDKYKATSRGGSNNLVYDWAGKIVEGKYQIPISISVLPKGKPLYIYINKDENIDNKTIEFSISKTVVVKNETVNISVDHFKLQDQKYKFIDMGFETAPIKTNFIKSQPSILLPSIEIKPSIVEIPPAYPDKKLNTSAQIMPFSDNMLSDNLKAKLDMDFIHEIEKICKSILENHKESGVEIYLKNSYPNNLEPFSIDAIETPLPTIDNTITDDPESLLKEMNMEDNSFKIIIFGHIDEDSITNELVLCIRAFITQLDDRLAFKERIKITANKIKTSTIQSKMEILIFQLLNSLPEKQIIDQQYKTLKTKQVSSPLTTSQPTTQAQSSTDHIWDQIDFDSKEYKKLSDIYEMNISNGFYCTLQDFTFDKFRQKFLSNSSWHNKYLRKLVPDNKDPLKSTFYVHVISEHTRNKHIKEYFIIKALDKQLDLIQAKNNIDGFNKKKFADQTNWKIPTIIELTQIFQFKKSKESISNPIKSFMPPFKNLDELSFWTSTFQDREKRILWKVTFKFKQAMDYDLKYHMIDSTKKAYLLPVSLQ